jgi:hypothetical protein
MEKKPLFQKRAEFRSSLPLPTGAGALVRECSTFAREETKKKRRRFRDSETTSATAGKEEHITIFVPKVGAFADAKRIRVTVEVLE